VAISGKDIDIRFDTSKPEGDRGRCADYSKARRVLGWSPTTTLRDGLAATYEWIAARV
jgi:GDP-D-mannose 3',5'-epimerase